MNCRLARILILALALAAPASADEREPPCAEWPDWSRAYDDLHGGTASESGRDGADEQAAVRGGVCWVSGLEPWVFPFASLKFDPQHADAHSGPTGEPRPGRPRLS